MADMFLELLDEMAMEESAEGTGGFTVDDDQKAEWVLRKLRDEDAEYKRIESVCNAEMKRYAEALKTAAEKHERRTANLHAMLTEYMQSAKTKATKTQITYTLPTAKLIIKHKNPKVVRDDTALLGWLKDNAPEYIREKVSYTPAWAELKDSLIVSGDEYATADGLIVEGVRLEAQPDEFVIQYQ